MLVDIPKRSSSHGPNAKSEWRIEAWLVDRLERPNRVTQRYVGCYTEIIVTGRMLKASGTAPRSLTGIMTQTSKICDAAICCNRDSISWICSLMNRRDSYSPHVENKHRRVIWTNASIVMARVTRVTGAMLCSMHTCLIDKRCRVTLTIFWRTFAYCWESES